MTGKVYLVGAGPSDPGLFTLKGLEVLEKADVVVHDALVGTEILGLIPEKARRVDVGKRAGNHPVSQDEINGILLREAQEGNLVVRLKGGDPFLFGRGGEELELLTEQGVPFEVVPGVSSAVAVPAYAGIPVTHRDYCSSVHIITGHTKKSPEAEIDYSALTRLNGTLVFLMGVSSLNIICQNLLKSGMNPAMPAAVLERGTTAKQRRISGTVSTLPALVEKAAVKPPAIIVVGQVCALADRFSWAEKRPLGGCQIVVTRPRSLSSKMAAVLRAEGAQVFELPTVSSKPLEINQRLDTALEGLSGYQWLALTSPTGVRLFLEHMRKIRFDIRRLFGVKLAAIGSATAQEMEAHGLLADLVPCHYNAAALGEALGAQGGRVLIVRAREGAPALTGALEAAGIKYDDIPIYDTTPETGSALFAGKLPDMREIDYVAFTSASTVHGFVKLLGERDYTGIRAVCIGASTEAAARAYGMKTYTAKKATIAAMTELMIELNRGSC